MILYFLFLLVITLKWCDVYMNVQVAGSYYEFAIEPLYYYSFLFVITHGFTLPSMVPTLTFWRVQDSKCVSTS